MRKKRKQKFTLAFFLKESFWGMFNAFAMISAGALVAGFFIYRDNTPGLFGLSELHFPQTTIIYDRTGKEILYEIHGEENRKILSHEEIPDVVRAATIAAEDKSFYQHFGVNPFSVLRALKTNIEKKGVYQGGSTITQQLARNVFLGREKTLRRKIMEALIAIKIERNFSKKDILDLYLNEVPYGSNAYGIESASETFFQKSAQELSISEAAFLAALPKAPTYFSPYGDHTKELEKRYEDVLLKMSKLNVFPEEKIEEAKKETILEKVAPFQEDIRAPHFVFYVLSELEKKYGREFLEEGGLKIVTSLDLNLQKNAEEAVSRGAAKNFSHGAENAALSAVDPINGDILAMVGSRDYFDPSFSGQVNVTTSLRQPGSSFKPIVYATAFEKGFQPETLVADAPTNFGSDGSGGDYVPKNYDGKFHGTLPMRKTLAMSLNIPAIKTLKEVGIDNAINMAHRLGITTLNERKRYGLSLAIGGAEVRPLDMVSAFSVFADDGVRSDLRPILKIKDKNGLKEEIYPQKKEVIDSEVARKINSVLSDNSARTPIFGPKSPLHIPGRTVAAKTGTTQEFRDAWTVGYTPCISAGVWAGNNDSRPMKAGSDGVFVAAPIWRDFMDRLPERFFCGDFIAYGSYKKDERVALDSGGNFSEKPKSKEKKNKK